MKNFQSSDGQLNGIGIKFEIMCEFLIADWDKILKVLTFIVATTSVILYWRVLKNSLNQSKKIRLDKIEEGFINKIDLIKDYYTRKGVIHTFDDNVEDSIFIKKIRSLQQSTHYKDDIIDKNNFKNFNHYKHSIFSVLDLFSIRSMNYKLLKEVELIINQISNSDLTNEQEKLLHLKIQIELLYDLDSIYYYLKTGINTKQLILPKIDNIRDQNIIGKFKIDNNDVCKLFFEIQNKLKTETIKVDL